MHIFGLEIRRAYRGKAPQEGQGAEVRFARLEEEVRDVREQARRLEGIAQRVEAAELAREAGFLKATEALRSVLGRIDARLGRKRPADRPGSDDGDSEHDWLAAYRSLRGHAPGAAAARVEAQLSDVTEDGE